MLDLNTTNFYHPILKFRPASIKKPDLIRDRYVIRLIFTSRKMSKVQAGQAGSNNTPVQELGKSLLRSYTIIWGFHASKNATPYEGLHQQ